MAIIKSLSIFAPRLLDLNTGIENTSSLINKLLAAIFSAGQGAVTFYLSY